MPRSPSDIIDRTIESLFARGSMPERGGSTSMPVVNFTGEESRPVCREVFPDEGTGPMRQATRIIETSDGPVWLVGNAVMCGCPQCEAPVSVRLWLMVADCWNCESAMELSYEQQRAAEKLSRQVTQESVPSPSRLQTVPSGPTPTQQVRNLQTEDEPERARRLIDIIRKSMETLPAWLISMLVHLVMLLILALILLPNSAEFPTITLSTAVGPQDEIGGINIDPPPELPEAFDVDLPAEFEDIERELDEVRIAAEQDARELLVDPSPTGDMPGLDAVRESITSNQSGFTMAIRDPRLRNEIVRREGGTTLSEAAVARGLRWLASVQNRDGSWSLADYRDHDDPDNEGDAAATSLALLPFLGAGQTHEYGMYKQTVSRGLRWLIEHQDDDGDLRHGIRTNAGIYAHGQASIVLVEALAMTGDEQFREPAQKAIDFIEKFQHKHGGWRYRRGEPGDTSVLGWQLMALQSAKASGSGLRVDDATLLLADQYLDLASREYSSRQYRRAPIGSLYRYQPTDRSPKVAMTAEGILCRMYLGWKRNDSRMLYAVDWLLRNALPDPDDREHNLYYYYYATQVMHHFGGKHWQTWNRYLRDLLVVKQVREGRYAGSWNPRHFQYGDSGGRIYVTALAICTLEVYYRHLPLFKQLDLQ